MTLTLAQVEYIVGQRLNAVEKMVGREGLLTLRSRLPYITRTTEDMLPTTIYTADGKSLRDNLRRFPQIESRAPNKVEFLPADITDTKALIEGKCEVPVAPDLIAFVQRVSKGFNREILEAMAHIERFGQRFDPGPEGITVADMAGQVIMNDRNTSNPICVPGRA